MMSTKNFYIIFVLAALFLLSSAETTKAAVLNISLDKNTVAIGDQINAIIKIDSEGIGINAVQTTLRFSKDIIQVVKFDKSSSVFNFWLQEPFFSNDEGQLDFIGGTTTGYSGSSLQVLKIAFKVVGSGKGTLTFTDAAVTASDGSGTNVLSKTLGAEISSVPSGQITTVTGPVPLPTQITRQAAPAQSLPTKPILAVPLYPDSAKWYNVSSNFGASWNLSDDIVEVASALNKDPAFAPFKPEGLFDNKMFASLDDGIWYLHVRFKNNIGWGPTAHYKIAVDTQPLLGFEVSILEGEKTDNPTPTLQFKTSDALSGLKEYQIRIGDGDLIRITAKDFTGSFKLPLQAPGKRRVLIKAIDQAENSVENSVDIEILPIASPTITFVTTELFSDEEKGLSIKGTALPNIKVLLTVRRTGVVIADGITNSDEKGNWEFTFDQHLKNGRYIVSVQSQDGRGALSLTVESQEIQVKSKPIIQIGKFQLGMGGALIFLLIVITGGFGGGVWFYKKRQEKLALRLLVVKTDMAKVFKLIQDDIGKLQQAIKTPTEADDEFIIKRLQENIKKMEGYLKKEIEKLE